MKTNMIRCSAGALLLLSGSSFAQEAGAGGKISLGAGKPAAEANADAAPPEAESPETDVSAAAEAEAPAVEADAQVPAAEAPEASVEAPEEDASLEFKEVPYMKRYVPEADLWELGLFGGVMFPSGSHELYELSADQQGFKAAGVIGARLAYFPWKGLGLELEGAGMPSAAKDKSSAGLWAARAHAIAQLPGNSVTPFLLLGGGFLGAESDAMGSDIDPSLNFGAGVKIPLDEYLLLRFDIRDNLSQKHDASQGVLTHHPELLVGFSLVPQRRLPDQDGDGVADHRDACPMVAGDFDGCPPPDQDGDGVIDEKDQCPEVASEHETGCPDSDGDGKIDSEDACPDESGTSPGGCPIKECGVSDSDGDGIIDSVDKCPEEAAATEDGCPVRDADGDGIPDDKDQCVDKPETKNGYKDRDGCPDEIPEEVKSFDGVLRGIVFEHGSDKISKTSEAALQRAIKVLTDFPSLHVEISGHTDSTGERELNLQLSEARAKAVKAYLVEKGIESARLETKGYGPDKPLAENKTDAGRRKNRRIEFHLVGE